MTDPSQTRKKKKITIIASEKGVEKAEKALVRLGFESKINFAESQLLSRGIVTKFFIQQPIQLDSFKKICKELTLKWEEIIEITEESPTSSQLEKQTNFSLSLEEGVETVKTSVRQVIAVDEQNQEVLVAVTLEGDIISVQIDAAFFQDHFSNKYPGSTIKVVAIQKGSIRLIIKGSSKDIQKLLSDFEAENLTRINGFLVQDIQILSESSEDDESSEQKWRLVEEIITNPIKRRNLRGVDLSDAGLRNASLINANLSRANLSSADLINANLSRTNLSLTNLSGANLSGANLSDANFIDANLSRADLIDADLSGAYLSGANVKNARFRNNQGISEDMKQGLIKRGAIFEDSPGDRSFLRA
ncbi:pentapeptide repeat-containing protein [Argonema galeatum]|uniref:pentapeptide repeat-containing protein n=1 Tax=Argonema galeatum TaxID=2942762 RepID=UPI0020112FC4|nr:pentapeptide repeat-containing protein [Argonema galeatum]MCL1465408.1 pentapeptide repeat-containing protein [Argonema galeatum A003/A1]